MNMGKKKNYESPFVKRAQVETESGFCAASIFEKGEKQGIKSAGHETGVDITFDDKNSWGDDWSKPSTK